MDKERTCCFTGHRPDKLPWGEREEDPRCLRLKERLVQAVEDAYISGCRHFICGMARGCDLYFAETVLALRDTGNTLQDPLTGRPVVVVEGELVKALLPELPGLDRQRLSHPVELMGELKETGLRFQLLPYRAVGVECGMLLALRARGIAVDGRPLGRLLVALSPTALDDGGGYQALIGGI